MIQVFQDPDLHPPTLACRPIPILLYADDVVLLSRTPIGIRRILKKLALYCEKEHLEINYQKTKVMAFGKQPRSRIWKLNGHKIEQVTKFKYLGVYIQASGAKSIHYSYTSDLGQRSANNILKFYRTKGRFFIPAALKLYSAKSLAQLTYGAFLGAPLSDIIKLERVQSKFLRALLQLPCCVTNSMVRLETGMLMVQDKICLSAIVMWLKLTHNSQDIAPLILKDNFQSSWTKAVKNEIQSLGFSTHFLSKLAHDQAASLVKQRIQDTRCQLDLSKTPTFLAPVKTRYVLAPATYLSQLVINKQRRAFTLARCSVLPSALVEGRYKNIPLSLRQCYCGSGQIETREHILFHCPAYADIRGNLIEPLIKKFLAHQDVERANRLLCDETPQVTIQLAKFCAAAIKIRCSKVI